MGYGHRSHQIGLDADIWFSRPKVSRRNEDQFFPSLVNRKKETIISSRLNARAIGMLRTAAEDPRVARIFVHWVIKKALCKKSFKNRDWLGKIRAWYGHDRHFHVRLKCPKDSPDCVDQKAIPPGDGCGAERYFSKARVMQRKAKERAARKKRLAAAKTLPEPNTLGRTLHRVHRFLIQPDVLFFSPMPSVDGSKASTEFQSALATFERGLVSSAGQYLSRVFAQGVVLTVSALLNPQQLLAHFKKLPTTRPSWSRSKKLHRRCAQHLLMNSGGESKTRSSDAH